MKYKIVEEDYDQKCPNNFAEDDQFAQQPNSNSNRKRFLLMLKNYFLFNGKALTYALFVERGLHG
jgi:hypothetical protein